MTKNGGILILHKEGLRFVKNINKIFKIARLNSPNFYV